jgi:hypothetical protein
VGLFSPKLLVAFDASGVCGARLPLRLGAPKVESLVRIPLPAGALQPAPFEENLLQPGEVRRALRELRGRLGDVARACLILPDGVARTLLLEPPPGTEAAAFARFRMAPSLPYASGEAVVDVLAVGRGRYVAAAVRRGVVRSYEAAAADAGFAQERVDLAPLTALAALLHEGPRGGFVALILGDAAFSLVACGDDGVPRLVRSRQRDPGADEAFRLKEELERTALAAGLGATPRVRIVGAGAPALMRTFAGQPVEAGWQASREGLPADAAELAWFGAALA